MKIFLLFTKPKIDFFFQFPVQFGRRAKRGGPEILDISESVDPTRFGLVTSALQMRRSAFELRAHQNYRGFSTKSEQM